MKFDDFQIILKGAIGYMTFGAYHMYITTNMINENNRNNLHSFYTFAHLNADLILK